MLCNVYYPRPFLRRWGEQWGHLLRATKFWSKQQCPVVIFNASTLRSNGDDWENLGILSEFIIPIRVSTFAADLHLSATNARVKRLAVICQLISLKKNNFSLNKASMKRTGTNKITEIKILLSFSLGMRV